MPPHFATKRSVDDTSEQPQPPQPQQRNKKQRLAKETDEILSKFLLNVHDETRRNEISQLHSMVTQHAPNLKPTLDFAHLLGYGKYRYDDAGREMDWIKIGISHRKNLISMHVYAVKNGKYILEAFDTKSLGQPKHIGKRCIRFSKVQDLNLSLLKKIIAAAGKADTLRF